MALLSFNSQSDISKFRKIRNQLSEMVDDRQIFTDSMIREFQSRLAKELNVNPMLFALIVSEMLTTLDPEEPENMNDLYLFLQGIIDAINMVYPKSFN